MRGEAPLRGWPPRAPLQDLGLVFGVYTLLALLNIVLGRAPGSIATVWFANGATAALIVSAGPGRRVLPMLLAAALGNLSANLAYGDPLHLAAAFVLPNVAEIALAVALLRRHGRVEHFAQDHRALLRLLLAGAALPPLLGATLGAALLDRLGFAPFLRVWSDWYVGALLGAVAMLPLLLSLRAASGVSALRRLLDGGTLLAVLAVVVATLAAVVLLAYPFVSIGVVLIAVAFLRPRLATFACVPLVVTVLAMALAWGWWVPATANSPLGNAQVFLAMLLVTVPALLVSVVVAQQRALAELLNAVGSRADEVIVFTGMDGRCRWANRTRETYFGVSNDELIGRPWREGMSPEMYERWVGPAFQRACAGELVRELVDFVYPSAGRRLVATVLQPAYDEEGHQVGVLASATDVTAVEASRRELALTAERLETSQRRLEQFVRIASHDLREPLNTVIQFCRLVESDPEHASWPAATRGYIAHASAGAERMRLMLDDVLRFVRLDAAPEEPPEPVVLDEVLAQVLADLDALLSRTGASVQRQPLGIVTGHRALLAIVLQNLVVNAVKFVPPGRTPVVRISADRGPGGETWVCVADNGIGIEAARIAELGQPFRRLNSRRYYDGTGLGLSICKRLAEQHGGRLEIQSTPGLGSRFALVLPAGLRSPPASPP